MSPSGLIVRGNARQREVPLFGNPRTKILGQKWGLHTLKHQLHTDRTDFGERYCDFGRHISAMGNFRGEAGRD